MLAVQFYLFIFFFLINIINLQKFKIVMVLLYRNIVFSVNNF